MIIFWFIFAIMVSLIVGVIIGINIGVRHYDKFKHNDDGTDSRDY